MRQFCKLAIMQRLYRPCKILALAQKLKFLMTFCLSWRIRSYLKINPQMAVMGLEHKIIVLGKHYLLLLQIIICVMKEIFDSNPKLIMWYFGPGNNSNNFSLQECDIIIWGPRTWTLYSFMSTLYIVPQIHLSVTL